MAGMSSNLYSFLQGRRNNSISVPWDSNHYDHLLEKITVGKRGARTFDDVFQHGHFPTGEFPCRIYIIHIYL